MTDADIRDRLLADLMAGRAASVHELALHPDMQFVPLFRMLRALYAMLDAGQIALVDPQRGVAAGGQVHLIGGAQ